LCDIKILVDISSKNSKISGIYTQKTTFSPPPPTPKKTISCPQKSLDAIMESSRRTALAHMKGGNDTPHNNVLNISIVNNC